MLGYGFGDVGTNIRTRTEPLLHLRVVGCRADVVWGEVVSFRGEGSHDAVVQPVRGAPD